MTLKNKFTVTEWGIRNTRMKHCFGCTDLSLKMNISYEMKMKYYDNCWNSWHF